MGESAPQEMSQHKKVFMKECIDRCLMYRLTFRKYHLSREQLSTYDKCQEYCGRELRLQRIKDVVARSSHESFPNSSHR